MFPTESDQLPKRLSGDTSNVPLIADKKEDDFYSYYKKLTPVSKVALWSMLLLVTVGTVVGLVILLRLKRDHQNETRFTLSGGPDVCGKFSNISSVRGLNGSRWEPFTSIEFIESNMSAEVDWESCYTPDITEGKAVIASYGNNQGYSISGTGSLIKTSRYNYNVTFNVNASCDRYELYMLSTDVGNMTCRSIGSPLKSELSPEEVPIGQYFNLSFEKNKQFGRRDDDDVVATYAIGDYDCYTSGGDENNSYAYTMGRYEAVCNRTNFCEVNPRTFGYTCEDDMYAWPTTSPCVYHIYMRDCPLNNTNSTDDDFNSTDDDINKTVSLWQRLWQKPSLGRRDSLTLFTLPPREAVNIQEEKEENHLRTGVYV
jgi:hypothetical protein